MNGLHVFNQQHKDALSGNFSHNVSTCGMWDGNVHITLLYKSLIVFVMVSDLVCTAGSWQFPCLDLPHYTCAHSEIC